MKDIATVLRRLYRLYLHAYYQHFSVFGEVELQQHLYERFYRFVTTNRLLSEKDMKPFLSLDEVFAVIYNAMCDCLLQYFSSLSLCFMELNLSRAEKRKNKKKQRKKQQRKLIALSIKNAQNLSDRSTSLEEKLGQEVSEQSELLESVISPSICNHCNQKKVHYHCIDCKLYLCHDVFPLVFSHVQCYEQIHRNLIKEKKEVHSNCIDLLEVEAKEKTTPIINTIDKLTRDMDFVPSSKDVQSSTKKTDQLQHTQHYGLRCKKCFELLVHDDEFLLVIIIC